MSAGTPAPVREDTGAGHWSPVRVTAYLAEPVVGLAEHAGMLDGPLSYAAFLAARDAGDPVEPITDVWAPDFALPLAVWTRPCTRQDPHPGLLAADAQAWGWACSRALYDPDGYGAAQIRRRPALGPMARYTTDAQHHAGLGPYKARDSVHPALAVRQVSWLALGDPAALLALLGRVTHLGRAVRHGHGRVLRWEVERDEDARAGWAHRPLPHPGGALDAIRAPYWHASRRMPCRG